MNKKTSVSDQRSAIKVLLFFLLFTVHCSLFSAFADTSDVYLSITKAGGAKIKIAIPDFLVQEGAIDRENFSKKSSEILTNDLNNSGFFKTIENRDILKEIDAKDKKTGKINFNEWTSLGAEILAKGHITIEGGKINIECRLYALKSGEQIIGYKYGGDRTTFRQMIHKFSDEITYRFTGENGIAQTMLTFVSKVTGNKEVYISDYDGQNIRKITDDKSISLFPKWSPDGKRLAVSLSKDGNAEIYTMDFDGKNLSRLTKSRSIETSPAWSPNGIEIAFTSDRGGSPQVYIMGSDGTNLRRLTYQGKHNDESSWPSYPSTISTAFRPATISYIFVIDLV